MGRIYAVALNTFREAVRDRILVGVLGCAGAVLVFTLALAELSLDQQMRVVLDIGLAAISFFSVVTAIFLGSSLLYKEIERKTLYVILPKPIRRHEFLLGKYFGIVMTGAVFIALMGAILLWVLSVQAGAPVSAVLGYPLALLVGGGIAFRFARDRTAVLFPFSLVALVAAAWLVAERGLELSPILAALVLSTSEVLILASVALLFSSFSTPFLTGAMTFGVWLVGRSADEMITMKSKLLSDTVKGALRLVAEVAPNLNLFVPGRQVLTAPGGPWAYVGTSSAYAILYAAIMLVIGALIFRRRDFL